MITKDDIGRVFYFTDSPAHEKRIIEVNQKGVYLIEMSGSTSAVPRQISCDFLNEEVKNERVVWVKEEGIKFPDKLSETQKEVSQKRWESIGLRWRDEKTRLLFLDCHKRTELIETIAEELNVKQQQTRILLTQFWRGGMTKGALCPKKKKRINITKTTIGRKAKQGKGLVVSEEVESLFEEAYNHYHLREGMSLKRTFDNLLKDNYCVRNDNEGASSFEYVDIEKTPTFNQFYYWLKNFRDEEAELRSKYGNKEFENSYSVLTSSTTVSTKGAGVRAELDATNLPIELVSERDRSLCVGTPLLELLVDVYSKMVMGFTLTLANESYQTGALTLLNSMENKKAFAERNGITIEDEDWPAHHLPQIILSDNGPFCKHFTDSLEREYGCYVQNATARKGSAKGNVERKNKTFEDYVRDALPGSSKNVQRGRGAKDPADEACLSLSELRQLIIKKIIEFNHTVINDYPLTPEQISQGISATPLELWNYSIRQATDHLTYIDDLERARIVLLPRVQDGRKVRKEGIRLFNFTYTSNDPHIQNWIINHIGQKPDVAYDPEDISEIYIVDEERIIPLKLNEKFKPFSQMSLKELKQYQHLKRKEENKQNERSQLKKLETLDFEEQIVQEAKSKSRRTVKKNKKGNRRREMKGEKTLVKENIEVSGESIKQSNQKDQLRSALFQERVNEIIKNKQES